MRISLTSLQPLGRALMLPIAVLPVAALLLRLGQPDLLGIPFVAAAGDAIFSNLGILFAIGVAIGLARENHGAAGLAGAVCFLVTIEGAKTLLAVPPDVASFADEAANTLAVAAWKTSQLAKLSVPAGILSGLVAGWLYNRCSNIRMPEYLAFFGGRRFVPIAAGFAGVIGAVAFGLGFPIIQAGFDALSRWVLGSGSFGLFAYGVLNRLLIVTGLHHIVNNIAWFLLGDFEGATGDIRRFFAGDPNAGQFMSGFFPVMMFGLPAACLAMYHAAAPARRKAVGGMLLSVALTSFLTGVTEPIEFAFMFLAPALYALHAVLTGVAMVVMNLLGVRLGFGFSAGLFDYVLNFGLATKPLLLLPVGAAYALIYYATFRYVIVRFDLKTPGRDAASEAAPSLSTGSDRAEGFVAALGGAGNLVTVDACTTRLRLVLNDSDAADENALKALGARGVVRPGPRALQVVLGPIADQVAGEIRDWLKASPAAAGESSAKAVVAALGGQANIAEASDHASRIRVTVRDEGLADLPALARLVRRGAAMVAPNRIHLLAGDAAPALMRELSGR